MFVPVSNAIAIPMNTSNRTHFTTTARLRTRRRRRSEEAPPTPLLHWTFYNSNTQSQKKKPHHRASSSSSRAEAAAAAGDHGPKFCGGSGRRVELSARKLAAGLWQLRLSSGLLRCGNDRLRFAPAGRGDVNRMLSQNHSTKEHSMGVKHLRRSRSAILGPKQGTFSRLESLFLHSKHLKNEATKWNSRCSEASIEGPCFASHVKLLQDQVKTLSFVSAIQAELMQAQYIHNLERELRSRRKKVKYLLKKLGEERASQQKKEQDKIYAVIDDMKIQLRRERKKLQKMDNINSQLVKELTETKSSAAELVQIYEKEKKSRKLLEEVCNELAMKIGEDKAEVEALRTEAIKYRDELEEERNMLQVAEVWREERVQMKLVDAKLALESKYSLMNKLISILENFLTPRITSLDLADIRTAELIGQAVKSINIEDMEAFSYEPMRSGDLLSILEELIRAEVREKETNSCFNKSSTGDVVPIVHPNSPERNDHDKENVPKHSSGFVDCNSSTERVAHVLNDYEGSVEEKGLSIIAVNECKTVPSFEIEQVEITGGGSSNTETSEICSMYAAAEQLKWKTSFTKLGISCASSSSNSSYKAISDEGKTRLSNGTFSVRGTNFLNRKSVKGGFVIKQKAMGQCGSTDSVNPHIARGTKGCIEWPRGKTDREKTPQLNTLNTG